MSDHSSILLDWKRGEGHDRVRVFVGPDRDHLAMTGALTLRPDEAERFRATVRQGIGQPGLVGIFERGWDQDEDDAG